jgi:hypothetical protein
MLEASGVKKCFFTLLLEAPPRSLLVGVVRVFGSSLVYHRWTFFFLLFSLLPKNYILTLFIIGI